MWKIPGAFAVLTLLTGCATLPNGRGWGEDATIAPGWERVGVSARRAAGDPWVWAPLALAGVLQIDDWDTGIADWAREETPVFGSNADAERWSDDLRTASGLAYRLSALATPSGTEAPQWLLNKVQGFAVGFAAAATTRFITSELKQTADRERPNAADKESFPSGHTSTSAVYTRLASRNLESLPIDATARRILDVGLDALVIGTSWSRIEAGWHYPSDTLVGMALGNFLASFFNDAFLGLDPAADSGASLQALPDGAELRWAVRF
jgi:hypothetical protein